MNPYYFRLLSYVFSFRNQIFWKGPLYSWFVCILSTSHSSPIHLVRFSATSQLKSLKTFVLLKQMNTFQFSSFLASTTCDIVGHSSSFGNTLFSWITSYVTFFSFPSCFSSISVTAVSSSTWWLNIRVHHDLVLSSLLSSFPSKVTTLVALVITYIEMVPSFPSPK